MIFNFADENPAYRRAHHTPSWLWASPSLAEMLGPFDDWRARAACAGADWRLFWPYAESERYHGHGYPERAERAAAFCHTCPVIAECRDWADAGREVGVWAGTWRSGGRSGGRGATDYRVVPIVGAVSA